MTRFCVTVCLAFVACSGYGAGESFQHSGAAALGRSRTDVPQNPTGLTPAWETIARSVEGRPIELVREGSGSHRQVLVIGPMRGDEQAALAMVDRLASHLTRFPDTAGGFDVTVLRLPNPDGYVRRRATNAHGVDINRNFGSSDWRKVADFNQWLSGRLPHSEPETSAIANLVDDLAPERIVLICSEDHAPWVGNSDGASELAAAVAALTSMENKTDRGADDSGSLETYAGVDRGIATLTISLPRDGSVENNWRQYSDSLLTAIRGLRSTASENAPTTLPSDSQQPSDLQSAPAAEFDVNSTDAWRPNRSLSPAAPEAPPVPASAPQALQESSSLSERFKTIMRSMKFWENAPPTGAATDAATARTEEHKSTAAAPLRAQTAAPPTKVVPWRASEKLIMVPVVSPRARRLQEAANKRASRDVGEASTARDDVATKPSARSSNALPSYPTLMRLPPIETRLPTPSPALNVQTVSDDRAWRPSGEPQQANSTRKQEANVEEAARWPQAPIPLVPSGAGRAN